ncbi:hypothetical protein QP175_07300 [Sphingomonas aerolata]|uniref:hypothetical protein n=1 Tax=Sphingomonas aerolata TaxID=185951 RepID=UPI002FE2B86B
MVHAIVLVARVTITFTETVVGWVCVLGFYPDIFVKLRRALVSHGNLSVLLVTNAQPAESSANVMKALSVDRYRGRHSIALPIKGLEIGHMRTLLVAAASLSLIAGGAPAFAAPCKDAKGRFTKCPPKAPAKPARCKSANGKFAKCGTAGAKPV